MSITSNQGDDRIPLIHAATRSDVLSSAIAARSVEAAVEAAVGASVEASVDSNSSTLSVRRPESIWSRLLWATIAIALFAAYLSFLLQYTAAGHAGNNQNGYLVTGKLLATTGSGRVVPESPFEFVGWMWGMSDETSTATGGGPHYAKYPLGYPILIAGVYAFAPDQHKEIAVYYINPIAMALGVLGVFFFARQFMSGFPSIVAMTLFGLSPVVLLLANNPNSHATATCFVVWGMALTSRFARTGGVTGGVTGGIVSGVLGGLFLGFAVTIRYTEGLLVVPLFIAVIWALFSTKVRWWILLLPLAAWMVLPTLQVAYNYYHMGAITGYDSTEESTGFSVKDLSRKWSAGLSSLYGTGAYFLLPLGLLGMIVMLRSLPRVGMLLILWFVPGTLLYMAYYWGQQMALWDFLRFFATILPPVFIAGVWLVWRAAVRDTPGRIDIAGSLIGATALLALLALTSAVNLEASIGPMQRDRTISSNIAASTVWIKQTIPENSVVFASSQRLLNHLQFASRSKRFYGADWLLGRFPVPPIRSGSELDANPIQPARRKYLEKAVESLSDKDRQSEAHRLIDKALDENLEVWVVLQREQSRQFRNRFLDAGKYQLESKTFTEPNSMSDRATKSLAGLATTGVSEPDPQTWTATRVSKRGATTRSAAPASTTTTPTTQQE